MLPPPHQGDRSVCPEGGSGVNLIVCIDFCIEAWVVYSLFFLMRTNIMVYPHNRDKSTFETKNDISQSLLDGLLI